MPPPIAALVKISRIKCVLTFSLLDSKVRKKDGIPIVMAEMIVN